MNIRFNRSMPCKGRSFVLCVSLSIVYCLLSITSTSGQEKVNLEYRLNKGDISKYKIILTNNVEEKGIVSTKAERTITEQIINVDCTQEVKEIKLDGTMEMAGTFTSFNEAIPQEVVKNLAGKKFFYRLNKKGEVLNFIPPQDVYGAPFTVDLLTAIFEHFQPRLPEKEVSVGNTWLSNLEISAPRPAEGKIFGNFNYTLAGIEKIGKISCAGITFWGTFISSLAARRGDKTVEINIIGSSEGKTYISIADGKVVKTDENLTLNIITGTTSTSEGKTETTHLQTIIKTDVNGELQ